jgi:hypothetical protein
MSRSRVATADPLHAVTFSTFDHGNVTIVYAIQMHVT